jgi:tRNA threonylcarbamoyladenosine biosynthesis protein TsaB
MKSTLLAVDTSTDACSLALLKDGQIHSDHRHLPREHTQNILPMVEAMVNNHGIALSDLDGLIVGAGPGSFTGLRIAFGVVQGLAFAVDKPVAAVSTLSALAIRAERLVKEAGLVNSGRQTQLEILATVDARMNELYWAKYELTTEGLSALTDASVSSADSINTENLLCAIGTGLVYQNQLPVSDALNSALIYAEERPRAEDLIRFALEYSKDVLWQRADEIEPLYVRNDVAKKKQEQKKQ